MIYVIREMRGQNKRQLEFKLCNTTSASLNFDVLEEEKKCIRVCIWVDSKKYINDFFRPIGIPDKIIRINNPGGDELICSITCHHSKTNLWRFHSPNGFAALVCLVKTAWTLDFYHYPLIFRATKGRLSDGIEKLKETMKGQLIS